MSARGKFTEIEEVKKLMIKVCNVEVEVEFENQKKRIIWNDLRGSILKQLLRLQHKSTNVFDFKLIFKCFYCYNGQSNFAFGFILEMGTTKVLNKNKLLF
jgi:hypothetical protein